MNNIKEEDDPVVKQIPVFLSKTLADKLFILQYPAYSRIGCENTTFLKTSIKPESQMIHMELGIDTANQNYDKSLGKDFAHHADSKSKGNDGNNENMFDSDMMDKVKLTSYPVVPDCSHFAVGIFQEGELHITPLKGILNMKLECDYLDEKDKCAKETKNTEDDDEDEESVSPVKIKFSRHLPDSLKKSQEQSFHHNSEKSQKERWIHTNYIPAYDDQADLTRMELFCQSAEESVNALREKNYLDMMTPSFPKDSNSRSIPENDIDFHNFATLPLLDQLRIIMKHVKVVAFSRLRTVLSPEHDIATVLKYLQQVAVLVQGNWIVNSELLYPKDHSSQSGISELMCKARDYILLSFTEQQFLHRNTISTVIKLSPEEMSEIFTDLGTFDQEKGWQLKEPPSWNFCERYPEIAQRQELFWDAKRKYLREMMEAQNQPPQRQRRKSNRESVGSENEERNVGRGRKSLRDSSLSDDGATEPVKHKKNSRSRKVSETAT